MAETKYPSNSRRVKEEQQNLPEKRVEKVISGKAKIKKNEMRKFTDVFISEDISSVKTFVLTEVIIPGVLNIIEDAITKGIRMALRGEAGVRSDRSGSKVNYSRFSDRRDDRGYRGSESIRSRSGLDYDDIIFATRGEAEAVLDQMERVIDTYGVVTVADLYDMIDETAPHTANKFGWSRLGSAEARSCREGYVLKLPRAMALD